MEATSGAAVHKPIGGDVDVSTTVVEALADAAGVDQSELPPLFESIDPDALDRLYETTGAEGYVRFHHAGFDVSVDGSGVVTVQKEKDRTVQRAD